MSIRLLTLNLWNINEPLEPRYRALETGLKRLAPDIVCLQEVSCDPKSKRSQTGLVAAMCGHRHYIEESGLAILGSRPIANFGSAPLPRFPGDPPRSVIMAEFQINGRPLLIINTHLAYPPQMVMERKRQATTLLNILKRRQSKNTATAKVLCGDFNDVASSPAVRTILDNGEKFIDAFNICHPGRAGFTYSPRNPYVERSWKIDERIDYIFMNRYLTSKKCAVVFDGRNGFDFASDHFGVFCDMQFARSTSTVG